MDNATKEERQRLLDAIREFDDNMQKVARNFHQMRIYASEKDTGEPFLIAAQDCAFKCLPLLEGMHTIAVKVMQPFLKPKEPTC